MAREKICGIYKITNLVNGKCYIGQSVNIYKRWEEHKSTYKNKNHKNYNYKIYKAIRKYGIENFKFEIIEECNNEDLNEREKYYIKEFDSFKHGYNGTLGGDGALGYIMNEETRYKIGHNREYKRGSESEKAKPIIFDGREYGCMEEICDLYGFNRNTIKRYLNHANNMPMEFYVLGLRYKDECMSKYKMRKPNEVYMKTTYIDDLEFENADLCSKYCNINPVRMRSWLRGQRKMPQEFYNRNLHYEGFEMRDYKIQGKIYDEDLVDKTLIKSNNTYYLNQKVFCKHNDVSIGQCNRWISGYTKIPKEYEYLNIQKVNYNDIRDNIKFEDIVLE